MSFSTASKLAALGEFAAPALWWVDARCTPAKTCAPGQRPGARATAGHLSPERPSRRLKSKVGAENDERS